MTITSEFDDVNRKELAFFSVVHPLDDEFEEKVNTEHLGPMRMTKTVRICLYILRGYLLIMFGLLGFRVLQLAGALRG